MSLLNVSAVVQLALDWLSGNWYFIDEEHEQIFVCSVDGNTCITLIHTQLEAPKALVLDSNRG